MAGPGLWRWAHLARRSWELPPETQPLMRDLAAAHRETVNLYVLRDIYRVCIAQQESPQPLRHVVHVGDELPLWAGASAKVLLRDAARACSTRIARRSPYGEDHAARLQEWIDEAAPRRATRSATASARRGCPRWRCRSSAGPGRWWPR